MPNIMAEGLNMPNNFRFGACSFYPRLLGIGAAKLDPSLSNSLQVFLSSLPDPVLTELLKDGVSTDSAGKGEGLSRLPESSTYLDQLDLREDTWKYKGNVNISYFLFPSWTVG